ncbi:DNA-processing protein DprA [Lawsonibacter sp. LCP25S3_G6]|uniref:DNA-processing protein DprA n=1 Tax=unclassified Lawsonibacter TaxID=2617946 RepID=UPI003F971492
MTELKYWLWLTTRPGMTPGKVLMLLDHFVTPERIYYADQEEYALFPLTERQRRGLEDKSMDRPQDILADCDRLGVDIMTLQDAAYPQRLRQLADPPAVLYWKGKKFLFDEEPAIAVVGSRKPTEYGERMAEKFGLELSRGGALVVSGIAEGLDTCAIRGALKGGGAVVSLLAGGVDRIVPKTNRFLAQDVAAVGALISEYPPGTEHKGEHYRPRNRILSGLCLGVLAVECRTFGGTMLTVNHALEQGRDVFAVPGALDNEMSEGTNRLIQQGAKLVTSGRDILEEYWDRFPLKLSATAPLPPQVVRERLERPVERQRPSQPDRNPEPKQPVQSQPSGREVVLRKDQKARFTDDELQIIAVLEEKPLSADEVVERTQISARYVLSALTMLQVQGAVEELPGRRFRALIELEQ